MDGLVENVGIIEGLVREMDLPAMPRPPNQTKERNHSRHSLATLAKPA